MEYDVRDAAGTFEIGGGGVVFFGGGFAKRGVRPNPPNPPGYGSARPVTKTCLEPIVVMVQSYRAPFARLSDPSRLSNQLEYCSPPPPKIS